MTDANIYAKFEDLSPFEIKDELIRLAQAEADKSARAFLNAGRGNPNWIATRAREAFFLLGQFALTEAKRVIEDDEVGLAGMPPLDGCHKRLKKWLEAHGRPDPRAPRRSRRSSTSRSPSSAFDPGRLRQRADRLRSSATTIPVPDRALVHNEAITHEFLMWAMCAGHRPNAKFDLYPVEGGTAAMCYIFKALKNARLLNAGDTIALGTPIFTPYLEMPHLEDYALKQIHVSSEARGPLPADRRGPEGARGQEGQGAVPRQSGQPVGGGARPRRRSARLVDFVKTKRPDLMILTDDVYGTFVPDFEFDHGPPAAQHHRRLFASRSTSAAPAGGSASSPSRRTTSSTR